MPGMHAGHSFFVAGVTTGTVPLVTFSVRTMSHADISGHKTAGDVTAFAKYNHLVIALPTSELAQSNDEAFVHGSFHAQMGTVPVVTLLSRIYQVFNSI